MLDLWWETLCPCRKAEKKQKGPCRNIAALTLWQFAMSDAWSVQISGLINLPVRAWDLKGPQPCGTALTQLVLMKFCRLENYSCQKKRPHQTWSLGVPSSPPPPPPLLSQHSYIAHSPPPSLPLPIPSSRLFPSSGSCTLLGKRNIVILSWLGCHRDIILTPPPATVRPSDNELSGVTAVTFWLSCFQLS